VVLVDKSHYACRDRNPGSSGVVSLFYRPSNADFCGGIAGRNCARRAQPHYRQSRYCNPVLRRVGSLHALPESSVFSRIPFHIRFGDVGIVRSIAADAQKMDKSVNLEPATGRVAIHRVALTSPNTRSSLCVQQRAAGPGITKNRSRA
jgi:hypothetical protein